MVEQFDRRKITKYYSEKGYVELEKKFPEEKYSWNEDLHPHTR
ncbi:MAG: hypothetical protein QXR34_09885 [Saccharolobus sp.]